MEQFANIAAETAMQAAAQYARTHGLNQNPLFDYGAATQILRVYVKAALQPAMADARQAFEANMPQVAEATFLASMRLAGINAMKEYAREL